MKMVFVKERLSLYRYKELIRERHINIDYRRSFAVDREVLNPPERRIMYAELVRSIRSQVLKRPLK